MTHSLVHTLLKILSTADGGLV